MRLILIQIGLFYILTSAFWIAHKFMARIKSKETFGQVSSLLFIVAILVLIFIYAVNFWNIGILIYTFGVLLNTIVIVANKGFMPVDINAASDKYSKIELETACKNSYGHTVLDNYTKFKILADRYTFSLFSIGDVFIYLGLIFIPLELVYIGISSLINLI